MNRMSSRIEFNCLPTAIGSMPHIDPQEACRLVLKYMPDIPPWPQLPQRCFEENMYAQYSEGFPGLSIKGEHIYIDRSSNFDLALEQFYLNYSQENITSCAISPEYAAGLYAFLNMGSSRFPIAKGQITGPITWGLSITGNDELAIIYDDVLADIIGKHLYLKVLWQERALEQVCQTALIFVDEPYLASLGSGFAALSEEQILGFLTEVLEGISVTRGIHCCGNADWSLLLRAPIDVLSFDAYNYTQSLLTYSEEVKGFLAEGGVIAWGIVPNDEERLGKETLSSLRDRLEESMAPFTRDGISFRQLVRQGLLTPSCGLASLSPEAAEQALELLAELSANLRGRYIS